MTADDTGPRFAPVDPYALARAEARSAQIARFYKTVSVAAKDGGFAPLLDGREARTPARRPMVLPTEAAAILLAAEWDAQDDPIDPGLMPAVRLANAVIDGVAHAMEAVQADVVRYGGSDLLCYRAEEPAELVEAQAAAWDPVLDWAAMGLGARLTLARGVIHVAQPATALAALERAVAAAAGEGPMAPYRLAALQVMTSLTGSVLLALAVLAEVCTPRAAWDKAHVDEDFQIRRWGEDAEALTRRERRWTEMQAAAALAAAVLPQG